MAVAAVINKDIIISARLPDEATIFSAEAKAIIIELPFEYIKMSKYTHFTIFSYSFSCLQSLHSMNIDHSYILDILCNYYYVSNQGKIVNFCWIPSHIGILGNNAAKSALVFEIVKFKIPSTDLKHFIKLYINLFGRYFGTFVIQVNLSLIHI